MGMDWTRDKVLLALGLAVLIIASIISIAVLVPRSYRDPDEQVSDNNPATTTPAATTKADTLQTTVSTPVTSNVTLTSIVVFTADRLELTINITFQYSINASNFTLVLDAYGAQYQDALVSQAKEAIKVEATGMTYGTFYNPLNVAEPALYQAVSARLGRAFHANVQHFQLFVTPEAPPVP